MKQRKTLVAIVALSLFALSASTPSFAQGSTKSSTPPPVAKKAPAVTRATVEVSALPPAVTEAVTKAHPKGTITKATKVTKESTVTFEVTVKDGTKTLPMTISDSGTVISPKPKGK